jgi:hypothetical protein
MATEVVHGPYPAFKTPLQKPDGTYSILVRGHYTTVDGIAAAGVSWVEWQSERPAKRQAELLSLRSAFIGWFIETYLQHGGTWAQAVAALRQYPYPKVRAVLKAHPDPLVARWGKAPTAKQAARMAQREGRETPVARKATDG